MDSAARRLPDPRGRTTWQIYKDKPWNSKDAKVAAAMDTMMDRQVGEITALLKKLGIYENTLMFFTSDNGAAKRFEESTTHVASCRKEAISQRGRHSRTNDSPVAWKKSNLARLAIILGIFPDAMPTLAEIAGVSKEAPKNIDGISVLPTLLGKGKQKQHEYMYWQYGVRAARSGKWKGNREGGVICTLRPEQGQG